MSSMKKSARCSKRRSKASVTKLEDLTIGFNYNGEVTLQDTQEILDKITSVHRQNG